jgi:hypothetical protein
MIKINSTLYQQILADINSIILKGDRIFINLYTDATGTQFVNDNSGHEIEKKMFVSISYQYPHDNVEGELKIIFNDGCFVIANDNNDNFWYSVEGVTNGIAPLK